MFLAGNLVVSMSFSDPFLYSPEIIISLTIQGYKNDFFAQNGLC